MLEIGGGGGEKEREEENCLWKLPLECICSNITLKKVSSIIVWTA